MFYITYEELTLIASTLPVNSSLFRVLHYLWGIDTFPSFSTRSSFSLKTIASFTLPMRNWHTVKLSTVAAVVAFYITYEELTLFQSFHQDGILTRFTLPMRNWHLLPIPEDLHRQLSCVLHYLWGIDTLCVWKTIKFSS